MNNPYKKHLKYLDGESTNGIEHMHRHAIYKDKYNQYDDNAVKSVPPTSSIKKTVIEEKDESYYDEDEEYSEGRGSTFMQLKPNRQYEKQLMQPYIVMPSHYTILHTPDPSSRFISPHATARISQYKKFLEGESGATAVSQLAPLDLKEKL